MARERTISSSWVSHKKCPWEEITGSDMSVASTIAYEEGHFTPREQQGQTVEAWHFWKNEIVQCHSMRFR